MEAPVAWFRNIGVVVYVRFGISVERGALLGVLVAVLA